jgi:peptidyl-prolyl cis-trans isomerase B (cyclophilin B)
MKSSHIRFSIIVLSLLPALADPVLSQTEESGQQVVINTDDGDIVLSLRPDKAPNQVRLFLARVAAGAYNGTSFTQIVKWGLIQGGWRPRDAESQATDADLSDWEKTRSEVSGLKHTRGSLSLVFGEKPGDSVPFFICVTSQPALDERYAPIGYVAEGIEVVDRISEAAVNERGVPLHPPVITSAELRPARPAPPPAFSDVPPEELAKFRAALETSFGEIVLEFLPELAPNHVRNFLRLAQAGFYDGTAFHRVVRDFVLQGGLLSTRQPALPEFRIADLVHRLQPEFSDTRHLKGIVSMARYDEPDSAETSFFICLGDATSLDGRYTVFGKVVDGWDVLERFQDVEVEGETPKERIELRKVRITQKRP